MHHSRNTEKYLDLSNVVRHNKKALFPGLKDRMQKRVDGWSARLLSQGGKEVFIKSVLQAIPSFAISCFVFPRTVCDDLERIIAKCWWQKGKGQTGLHWCEWKTMCELKENGGLRF